MKGYATENGNGTLSLPPDEIKRCTSSEMQIRLLSTLRLRLFSTSMRTATAADYETANIKRKKSLEKRRRLLKVKERQATLLLGLILTAFIASWLPFFVGFRRLAELTR